MVTWSHHHDSEFRQTCSNANCLTNYFYIHCYIIQTPVLYTHKHTCFLWATLQCFQHHKLYSAEWLDDRWTGMDLEGSSCGPLEVLYWFLPWGTEEKDQKKIFCQDRRYPGCWFKLLPHISLEHYHSTELLSQTVMNKWLASHRGSFAWRGYTHASMSQTSHQFITKNVKDADYSSQ
jgi:hypothetical protein